MLLTDQRLSRRIHELELGCLDYLLVVPGLAFGEWGIPWLIVLFAATLGWRFALAFGACSLLTAAAVTALKHATRRSRPEPPKRRAVPLRRLVSNPAFPSGDSAQVGVVVVFLLLAGPFEDARRWLFVPLAPLCMFARVYFGAHWIGDTLVGVAIGAGVALLAWPLGVAAWLADASGF